MCQNNQDTQAHIKRAAMAGPRSLNEKNNAVRFASFHVPEHHDECVGTRRSAWKSEESSSSKIRDRLDLPPRRPSREMDFLNDIPEDLFLGGESLAAEIACDERQPVPQHSRSSRQPRSILKTSKYKMSEPSPKLDRRNSPKKMDDSNNSSSSHSGELKHPATLLMQKHKDSILDLPQLALRCKPKLDREGSTSSISVPSLVCITSQEDDCMHLRLSSLSNADLIEEKGDHFFGLDCD